MVDYKQQISKKISAAIEVDENELCSYIEIPPDSLMGDYAFPCFRLAKNLRKAPQIIAQEIKEKLENENIDFIEKIEVAGGYLNFFIRRSSLVQNVLKEISIKNEDYGKSDIGEGKNIVIDYSSPNIAKPFHIGHLRSTVIGGALYNIYNFLGYNSIGINHLGDYGTQFGKLIEGYKLWGNEYDIENNPVDELTKIYIRINALCKEDEQVLENCRLNFKKLEDGDEYCKELWQRFRDLSLKEFDKVYKMLGSKFDSWNGEAFYFDKMDEIVSILEREGKLTLSEGAKIVDLEDKGMAPCLIKKSDGSTTYATRDLAAILYRVRNYDFDKAIYVTSYEQILHFKQIFEVAKSLGIDEKYTNNLTHVPFGMVHLKTGKMSTREGNIVKLEDLLNESISRVKEIINLKNPDLENKDEIAKKVGIGAVIFNDLSNNRIKDEIFDWNTLLNFQGETGPYLQYMYVRTNSILNKAGQAPNFEDVDFEVLTDNESVNVIKLLNNYTDIVKDAANKNEPSIIARYLINLSQAFSNFYSLNKIIGEEEKIEKSRLYLTYSVGIVLKSGAKLLGIEMPDRM